MWPNVALLDVYLLTFRGDVFGQTILNTFPYQVTSVTGDAKPIDEFSQAFFADLEYVALESDFLAALPDTYHLNETWFQNIFPNRRRKTILERDLNGGIDTGQPNSANLAAVISRHGAIADKKNNGGVHLIAPFGQEWVEEGLITGAYKTLLQALAVQMEEVIEVTVDGTVYELTPCLVRETDVSPFYGTRLIVETNVQDTVRVMRRRTVGLGI